MNIAWEIALFLALGLATGFVSGLLGIGGGIVRIPLFIYMLPLIGVEQRQLMHVAVGTSIALCIPTAVSASIKQYQQGNLDLGFYRNWAIGVFVGVIVGLFLVPYISTEAFQIIFVVFLLSVAVYVGFAPESIRVSDSPPRGLTRIGLGSAVGIAAALTGTGGGALVTPALKAFSMPIKKAIATASATGLVVGTVGTVGFVIHGWGTPARPSYSLGYVDLVVALGMMPTVLIGAPLGAHASNAMNEKVVKWTYALFLLVIAADLIYKLR